MPEDATAKMRTESGLETQSSPDMVQSSISRTTPELIWLDNITRTVFQDPPGLELVPLERGSTVDLNSPLDVTSPAGATSTIGLGNPVDAASAIRHGHPVDDYPTGARLFIVFLALALSVLIVGLDGSIVATATPQITNTFNALDDVSWYGSAYLLGGCTCQLAYGRVYQLFSLKWVFVSAIIIFEVGSVIAAVAPTSAVFIVGRAVSGIGFAGIGTGALILVAHALPLQRRPLFTTVIGTMEGLGLILGPLVGGALTTHASWRWCFWINLPIGTAAALVIAFLLTPPKIREASPERTVLQTWRRFDWVGTIVFVPSITCLLLALQWGGSKYQWHNARVIACFILFALFLTAFVLTQRYAAAPTIPRRVASSRSIIFGASFAFALSSAVAILGYFLPLWFQGIKSASALDSGIMLLPMILGVIAGAIPGGVLVTMLGYYQPFMMLSGATTAVAAGLFTTFVAATPKSVWIGYQVLAGIGVGLGFQQPFIAAQAALDIDDVATGTALIIFAQTLAGAIFVSVGGTIFSNTLIDGVTKQIPQIDPRLVLELGATNLRNSIPARLLDVVLHIYDQAITHTFYAAVATSALAFFLSLGMEWKSIKKKKTNSCNASISPEHGAGRDELRQGSELLNDNL